MDAAPEPPDERSRAMMVRHRGWALAYRSIATVVILIGVTRILGLFTPEPTWSTFLYYTGLSNVLCLIWMTATAAVTLRDLRAKGAVGASTPSARGAGFVMMAITVTMLIYLLVLVPVMFTQPGTFRPFTLTDNLVHIITPALIIVDWLLFVPKGRFRALDPVRWALIPYAYLLLAFVYGALGGSFLGGSRYPYPFMDVDVHGVLGVIVWIGGLTVALIAVGYVYFGLDRWMRGWRTAVASAPATAA